MLGPVLPRTQQLYTGVQNCTKRYPSQPTPSSQRTRNIIAKLKVLGIQAVELLPRISLLGSSLNKLVLCSDSGLLHKPHYTGQHRQKKRLKKTQVVGDSTPLRVTTQLRERQPSPARIL